MAAMTALCEARSAARSWASRRRDAASRTAPSVSSLASRPAHRRRTSACSSVLTPPSPPSSSVLTATLGVRSASLVAAGCRCVPSGAVASPSEGNRAELLLSLSPISSCTVRPFTAWPLTARSFTAAAYFRGWASREVSSVRA
eukprot:scaffold5814_cov123-Isochrysis_galbana.AAC.2